MSENSEMSVFSARRKQRYKDLLDRGLEIRNAVATEENIDSFEEISNIIKETDSINDEADVKEGSTNTTEIVMDAQVVKMSHELVGDVMQKIENSEFSDNEYINAIINLINKNGIENWDILAETAVKIANTLTFRPCLLGSFETEPVVQERVEKEKRTRIKQTLGQEEQPEFVNKQNKIDEGAKKLSIIYNEICKIYEENDGDPIPFYQLVIDPNNFMNTIDIAFQVAFLIKSSTLAIERGSDGYPWIRPSSKEEQTTANNDTVQAIATFNTSLCDEMIKRYNIQEPLLSINKK